MKKLRNNKGYTIAELLIAMFITGVLAAAGFEFYISMHNQTLAQEEISDMQQASRASLQDITRTLRMAGYKIGSHDPYAINGDSLYIFFNGTQPVDSVLYYLADYSESELAGMASFPTGSTPHKLMKKVNSATAELFADYITDVTFTAINSSTVQVTIDVQAAQPDEDFVDNGGYRTFTALETVNLRNVAL
ncbi:MAG: prepilin-type N-terminal cleavage/methylation domain-containing protein [Candidatus Zixiibacteriota bacterium]